MCGIAGLLKINKKPVNQYLIHRMTNILLHRGPDGEGFYFDNDNGVAFGHRRLAIIDLDGGHQPMSNSDQTIWITYNGEIYNYLELRMQLISLGHKFKTHCDTEVIIHLYEEYGEACLEKLNGMFAFAIWDKRKKRLFAARDRLGIKPFYYFYDGSTFAFASEIKAILQCDFVSSKVNYDAIADYLTFQYCLGDKTLFKDIKKLEPGNYIIFDGNGLNIRPYWDINFNSLVSDDSYYADKLLMLLEDSVRLQLRSDVPVGSYLSGGLDSSAVSAVAASLLGGMTKTFSGGFSESREYDETEYARIVSRRYGTDHYEVFPTSKQFAENIQKIIYHLDEPVAGPGVFPQYAVASLASEKVKVILGGQGGDELFGGYARYLLAYFEETLKGAIFETYQKGQFVVTLETIIPNLPILKNYTPMMQDFWKEGLFASSDERYFQLINRHKNSSQVFSRELLQKLNFGQTKDEFKKLFNSQGIESLINKMLHFDLKTLLPALLHIEDRVSMAFSLESRVPLLDHRIVEFAASLPPTVKFKDGETKHILRQAVRNVVPWEILQRKDKMGFPVPLAEWIKSDLKDFVCDILLSREAKERGIWQTENIEKLLCDERKFGRDVWGMLSLELWFRTFNVSM